MRGFLYKVLELFQEQWGMMKLTRAQAACRSFGHEDGQLILWHDLYQVVCPRCGKDME
jgi:hypothetical protein